tara:strand:+ start:579 stop:1583 length:1005 start_codon:yes stop_codon:yes gene_type:complete
MSDEALTLDAAVETLMATDEDKTETTQTETAETTETAQDDVTQDTEAGEEQQELEATPEANNTEEEPLEVNQDGEQENEAVQPSIEAPQFWQADSKAAWANVPDDVKPIIQAEIKRAEANMTKVQMEAANKIREAESKAGVPDDVMAKIQTTLGKVNNDFEAKWGQATAADWAALAAADPAQYTQLQAEMNADKAALDEIQTLEREQTLKAQSEFLQKEMEVAKEVFPELLDPIKGPPIQKKLNEFLTGLGYDNNQIRMASANELSMAHKAILWDESQAALKSQKVPVAPKPIKAKKSVTVKSNKSLEALREKAFSSGKLDDMVEYEMERSKAG